MKSLHFRSVSWGYHEPGGAVLWWRMAPSRHLHILSELCFEQLDESELASRIKARDAKLNAKPISYTVGTPAIVSDPKQKARGVKGETIGDRLAHYGIVIIAADDDTLNGWKRCHSLLRPSPDGTPWLTIDPSCEQFIRAVPSGLRDDKDPEDVREPHPTLTAFRYGAMSRPSPETSLPVEVYPVDSPGFLQQQVQRAWRRGLRL